MPDAAIMGSMSVGHAGFLPHFAVVGQPKFLIFGTPIHCSGDAWMPHILPSVPPQIHGGSAIGGSKFLVFGKPAAMLGDTVDCGSPIMTGQPLFQIS